MPLWDESSFKDGESLILWRTPINWSIRKNSLRLFMIKWKRHHGETDRLLSLTIGVEKDSIEEVQFQDG